jgi:basic membrane lipoprotein Med (substrate-binding protein (PBP1-ABC) superfamily)
MRRILYAGLTALLLVSAGKDVVAQTAGQTTLGVTVVELADVVKGWSAQKQLLGQSVYNDKDEKIGKIEDIIITPERSVSYAIAESERLRTLSPREAGQ